jgi:hypothetical protein
MDWVGLDWVGLDWTGMEWTGMEWTGMEWNGMGHPTAIPFTICLTYPIFPIGQHALCQLRCFPFSYL